MEFKYSKLRGRIVEKFGNNKAFAAKLGISETQLSKKLNCRSGFSQADIIRWCELLDVSLKNVGLFFFA